MNRNTSGPGRDPASLEVAGVDVPLHPSNPLAAADTPTGGKDVSAPALRVGSGSNPGTGASGRFSWIPVEWAKLDIPGRAWRVLAILQGHAGHSGVCWPSIATIAELTGVHPDNVKVELRTLRRLGIITRADGRVDRKIRINYEWIRELAEKPELMADSSRKANQKAANKLSHLARKGPTSTLRDEVATDKKGPESAPVVYPRGVADDLSKDDQPAPFEGSSAIPQGSKTEDPPGFDPSGIIGDPLRIRSGGVIGVVPDPFKGIADDPLEGSRVIPQGIAGDPSHKKRPWKDQEKKSGKEASNAPAGGHAHAREQAAGLAAASSEGFPIQGNPEPASPARTPPSFPAPSPPPGIGKAHGVSGFLPPPIPKAVDPEILAQIAKDIERDDLGFWAERLLAMGCPDDWLLPLFRSFWCRRGSKLPRTFRPLELRFRDWHRAGAPIREQLAEADLKALEASELEAAKRRQREEFLKALADTTKGA